MFYSPLRYPGGKGKLEPFMELLIRQTGHLGGTYVEPFAGGAGIALELLEKEIVNDIVINDLNKRINIFIIQMDVVFSFCNFYNTFN